MSDAKCKLGPFEGATLCIDGCEQAGKCLRSKDCPSIAEQCAKIAEEWIIPDERLESTTGTRRLAGVAQSFTAREIATAIRERMGEKR